LFDFSFEVVEGVDDMKVMIANEIRDFKQKLNQGGDVTNLPSVPKPAAPLAGPTRSPGAGFEPDDLDHSGGPMDIDEEFRMKGH
jgi:hypothetical protein